MSGIRAPKSVKQATVLLERFAQLEGRIAAAEVARNSELSAVNARADAVTEPLLAERDAIRAKLEPWWASAAQELTAGKRKSIELGGCMIGSRAGRESLAIAGKEDDVVKALEKRSWAKPLLRVTTKLDRKAVLMSLTGMYRKQLAALGLSRDTGAEAFFVERVEQQGTLAGVSA